MIKLGMPTLIELEDLSDNVVLCKALGLDFIEVNMNMPEFQPNHLKSKVLNEIREQHAIYFTFHLPEDLDIGHFNTRIRQANLEIIQETINIAKEVQAPIINMHMSRGIYFTLPTHKVDLYDKYEDRYLENICDSIDQIEKMLKDTPVRLTVENTGLFSKKHIAHAVEILLHNDRCSLTWDIGHDYSSEKKDEAFILHHIQKLRHMHIHDAIGTQNHLELYTGELDLEYYFKYALENGCRCVIETKTVDALKKSVSKLKDKF